MLPAIIFNSISIVISAIYVYTNFTWQFSYGVVYYVYNKERREQNMITISYTSHNTFTAKNVSCEAALIKFIDKFLPADATDITVMRHGVIIRFTWME